MWLLQQAYYLLCFEEVVPSERLDTAMKMRKDFYVITTLLHVKGVHIHKLGVPIRCTLKRVQYHELSLFVKW